MINALHVDRDAGGGEGTVHALPHVTADMRRALRRIGITAALERRVVPQSLVRGELTIGGEAAALDANTEWIRKHSNLRSVKTSPLTPAEVTRTLRALRLHFPEPNLSAAETAIAKVLSRVAIAGGSDLFAIPNSKRVRLVAKVLGVPRQIGSMDLGQYEEFVTGSVAPRLGSQVDFKVSQTCRYEVNFDGVQASCRLRTWHKITRLDSGDKAQVMLNFRLHPDQLDLPQPEELDIRSDALSALRRVLEQERLPVLVAGMPDAGKTTTLLSILREIARLGLLVFTFEAPIEMEVDELNQTEVTAIGGDGTLADRQSLLQMNPDLVLVGEALGRDAFGPLMEFIEAGVPSVTTLHEHTGFWALYRAMQLAGERFLNKAGLIWCQSLVAPVCKECGEQIEPSPALHYRFKLHGDELPDRVWHRTVGADCQQCSGTGVTGPRNPFVEFFYVNSTLRKAIRNRSWEPGDLAKEFYPQGATMAAQGIRALQSGEIDDIEFLRLGDDLV